MNATELFVRCLEKEDIDYIFGIPGEENIDMMDVLLDEDSENKSPLTDRDNVRGRTRPAEVTSHASARRRSVRSDIRNARMGRTHA